MPRSFTRRAVLPVALLLSAAGAWSQADLSLAQARRAADAPVATTRLAAVERLGEVGTSSDVDRLLARLSDRDEHVQAAATTALWQIWSRSGDPAVDALLARGLDELRSARLDAALATFDEIVRRRPGFAEGWNRRATVKHLLGRHAESLRDTAEALKRNPVHFGALSTAGQSHLALGQRDRAVDALRRALRLNPNLDGVAQTLRQLEPAAEAVRRSRS